VLSPIVVRWRIERKGGAMKKLMIRSRASTLFLLLLLSPVTVWAELTHDAAGRRVLVSRDSLGRVQRRIILNADGSQHTTASEFWPHGNVARRVVDEDRDGTGRPTGRTLQRFDARGRILERRAVVIDAAGQERGTHTRYSYDAGGRSSQTTSPVAPPQDSRGQYGVAR
jgi:hypothetical protein